MRIRSIDVQYSGPETLSRDRILAQMRTKVGDTYSDAIVEQDIRNLYNTGGIVDWDELMLGNALREKIEREIPLRAATVSTRRVSADGTVKLLLEMNRGGTSETVLMTTPRADRAAGWEDATQLTFDEAFVSTIELLPDGERLVSAQNGFLFTPKEHNHGRQRRHRLGL